MNDQSVAIVEYDGQWTEIYEAEAKNLRAALGPVVCEIEHIGSTAVPGLAAKPVIDIVIGIKDLSGLDEYARKIEALGYKVLPEHNSPSVLRLQFQKDSLPLGYHIDLVFADGPVYKSFVLFRDYLRSSSYAVGEYENLKRTMLAKFAEDPSIYADSKIAFVAFALSNYADLDPAILAPLLTVRRQADIT